MIHIKNVNRKLGDFQLKDVSLDLPSGYIMGLIGENGAGKTSLIHILLGLYKADEGEVRVFGKEYLTDEKDIRDDIGVVLQERLFDSNRTLLQNANAYGEFYSNYSAKVFAEYMERFKLDMDKKYKSLSKGEEIKFQFAFAMSHAPKLLILDEATGNFDSEFREQFLKILTDFVSDGEHSVILSTHITDDLERIADYITYMENGNVLITTDIESLRDMYRVANAETYKIKLLPKEEIIYMEEGEYVTKALIKYRRRKVYDSMITLTVPTIEEIMYFLSKAHKNKRKFHISKAIYPKGLREEWER